VSLQAELPAALEGERLDRAIALLAGVSRSLAAQLVAAGRVRVDGRTATGRSRRLAAGEVIEVDLPETPQGLCPSTSMDVPVLFADEALIVVDKPAGVVVHPGAGTSGPTLVEGLLARYPELAGVGDPERPGIVHRLDRGTSGLLVVGRSEAARAALVAQVAARRVERRYVALVSPPPPSDRGVVDAPIGRSTTDRTRMAVSAEGRPARTRYRVLGTSGGQQTVALVECALETGRTHQIRVHLAALGSPVVGDERYGRRGDWLGLERPFLHAFRLVLDHPVTGQRLRFTSPLPDDLGTALARLAPPRGSSAPAAPSRPQA
jgi:23S rRNA pseudouridine1911/1915/1917 synthase